MKKDLQSLRKGLGQVRDKRVEQTPPTIAQYTPYAGYGYAGEWEDDNGLIYLRARYYNHEHGRFISLDPLEGSMNEPISLNRYAYADNNPVNKTDPSGLCATPDCVSAVNQLEAAHQNVSIYWPGRIPGGLYTFPTLTPTPTPTVTATSSYTPSPTSTPSPTFTPTPTLAVCPTPSYTSTPTGTPTVTFTPTITPTPTNPPMSTALAQLSAYLENPTNWQTGEVNMVREALGVYTSVRGIPFNLAFVRSQNLSSGGRTIGDNSNLGVHRSGSNLTILLGNSWSNNIQNAQYGKWLVAHEINHAMPWFIRGTRQRYLELGTQAMAFVTDPGNPALFPTSYAAQNLYTGTEYLAEGMTGMIWDRAGQTPPDLAPHDYRNPVGEIVNSEGITLDNWIRQYVPTFIP